MLDAEGEYSAQSSSNESKYLEKQKKLVQNFNEV